MPNDIKGFKAKKKLKNWSYLLQEWIFLNEKYSLRHAPDETVFDFNERTNIGILSVAAWRCGWFALEEFRCDKSINGEVKEGRADLWIEYEEYDDIYIEAKHRKISLNSKVIVEQVSDGLGSAYADAIKTKNGEDIDAAAGLLFCRIFVKQNNSSDEIQNKVNKIVAELSTGVNYDAFGYYFPEQRLTDSKSDEYSRLGILLFAKAVK